MCLICACCCGFICKRLCKKRREDAGEIEIGAIRKLSSSIAISHSGSELSDKTDDYKDEIVEAEVIGTSGAPWACFNFINAIVGSGIIGLPFAVNECGFIAGIILIALVAIATDYSVRILLRAGLENNVRSYEALMEKLFGMKGKYLISILMFLLAYGAMISYLIIIGETIPTVTRSTLGPDSWMANRQYVIILFGTAVVLPLCLLKDMGNLSYSSLLSVVSVIVVLIIVLVRGSDPEYQTAKGGGKLDFIESSIFGGISTMAFAFVCHHSAFVIFSTLKEGTTKQWTRVTHTSIGVSFVLSFTMATFGYMTFGAETKANILDNFRIDDDAINAARVLLALTMFFTFPMEQFVGRHVLHSIIFRTHVVTNLQHYGLTILLWGTAMIIAVFVDNLGVVLELTGAISASTAGYILPTVVYFKTFGFKNIFNDFWKSGKEDSQHYQETRLGKLAAVNRFTTPMAIAIVGVFVFFMGTLTAISEAEGKRGLFGR